MSRLNPIKNVQLSPISMYIHPALGAILACVYFYLVIKLEAPNKEGYFICFFLYVFSLTTLYFRQKHTAHLPNIVLIPLLLIYLGSTTAIGFFIFLLSIDQVGAYAEKIGFDPWMTKTAYVLAAMAIFLISAMIENYKRSNKETN